MSSLWEAIQYTRQPQGPSPASYWSVLCYYEYKQGLNMSVFVCLWAYLWNYASSLYHFLVVVTYCHGSIFLCHSGDMLRTSSFMDDVMFAHNGPYGSVSKVLQWVTSLHTHTHTHPFNGPFSGTTQVGRYQKGKTNLDLLKQDTVSGSGISWTICKSAPRSRQITTPAPHQSVFLQALSA